MEGANRLTYTEFMAQVDRGNVRSVKVRPDGHTRGTMADGSRFVTTIPVTLSGDGLLERLEGKSVTVEAVPAVLALVAFLVAYYRKVLVPGYEWWDHQSSNQSEVASSALRLSRGATDVARKPPQLQQAA